MFKKAFALCIATGSMALFAAPSSVELQLEPKTEITKYTMIPSSKVWTQKIATEEGKAFAQVTNSKPDRYCSFEVRTPLQVTATNVLRFSYRNEAVDGVLPAYTAININTADKKLYIYQLKTAANWQDVQVPLTKFIPVTKDAGPLTAGTEIKNIIVYAKLNNPGIMILDVKDFRVTEK